jgi:hypothetical protein
MHRRTIAALCAAVPLSACQSLPQPPSEPSPAQSAATDPRPLTDRRLLPFLGAWTVEAAFHPDPAADPAGRRVTLTGAARFEPAADARSLRETLTLGDFSATTTLGYSPARGRYELAQIDNATGGQLWLVGRWSADGRTLELAPASPDQMRGLDVADMRWSYAFDDRGRLIKTIRIEDAGGIWRTQSTYIYSRP